MNALLLSAILGVVMMFCSILFKKRMPVRITAIVGISLLLLVTCLEMYGTHFVHINTAGMMNFSRYSLLFNAIALASILFYFLLSGRDMEKVGTYYGDYFALIFFIVCGIMMVSSFQSLLILFLGIEIISIPLYILTGSDKKNLKSNEASLKYFLMGAFSTGLMLMGITLIYGGTGTFVLEPQRFAAVTASPLVQGGILLLLFSMAFKVSAAPFHFWTPDVYDGAPTVFTSFMATVVKAALFVSFLNLFSDSLAAFRNIWQFWVSVMVVITLFIGNITAVFQQSIKRMLAYSSIAQAGFMLLAVYAGNESAKEGLLLYAAAYSLATICIFAVLIKLKDNTFDGLNGFARQQPLLAASITISILSLAGIPLTAGFLAKFYMIRSVIATGHSIWLVVFALLMAAVSVYYYFRVIQSMYFKQGETEEIQVSGGFKFVMAVVAALVIILGLFPNLILNWLYF